MGGEPKTRPLDNVEHPAYSVPMHAVIAAEVKIDVSALIAAIVWPAVLLILALTYRDSIRSLFQAAVRRGFRLSLPGGWSVDLAGAKEKEIGWVSGRMEVDLRRPVASAAITDSTRAEFAGQLRDRTPADYARIDLGNGEEWLSSRLYFMAVVLQKLRGLKAFVFLDSWGGVSDHFVGWAALDDVRWCLARRFPRLERAFVEASCELADRSSVVLARGEPLLAPDGSQQAVPPGAVPDPEAPASLLAFFLNRIQLSTVPTSEQVDWVPLSPTPLGPAPATTMYEHGRWLDATQSQEVLGPTLLTASIREEDLLIKQDAEVAELVADHEGRYLAVTRDRGRFSRLIDRDALLRQLARAAVRRT